MSTSCYMCLRHTQKGVNMLADAPDALKEGTSFNDVEISTSAPRDQRGVVSRVLTLHYFFPVKRFENG